MKRLKIALKCYQVAVKLGGASTTSAKYSLNVAHATLSLRRIAVGRGNWTFLGSENGGHTAAVLFSFIATCQRHGVNVFDYLCDVLARIDAHPMNQLVELLPDHWHPVTAAIPD